MKHVHKPGAESRTTDRATRKRLKLIAGAARRAETVDDVTCVDGRVEYRDKSHGYRRDETSIAAIIDQHGQELTASWDRNWQEIAPGIETCRRQESKREGAVETVLTQRLRIHRAACPVHVLFTRAACVVPYGRSGDLGDTSSQWWVCYQA